MSPNRCRRYNANASIAVAVLGKNWKGLRMPDPPSATIVAAILGAFLGAIMTAVSSYLLGLRKHRQDAKRRIVGEIGSLTDSYIAELIELHAAVTASDTALAASKRAGTYRLKGAGGALEIELLNYFRDRRTWATFHKVLDRWEVALKWIVDGESKSADDAQLAFDWIYQQRAIAIQHAAREAGTAVTSRGGIKFLGFRFGRAKREFIRDLSFEDGPPPWEFSISYDFSDRPFTPDELKSATKAHTAMVGALRCANHHRPAQVRLHGKRRNFSIQIEACCEEFSQQVLAGLGGKP